MSVILIMNLFKYYLTGILFFCLTFLCSHELRSKTSDNNALQVPFIQDRNKIIIPTAVNGLPAINLILDTGMRFDGIYLFHQDFIDQIDTAGAIEVRVGGAGAGEASTNLMIESATLGFGQITLDSQRVIISRSEHTQTFPTDGVIGWNLFGHYAVEIDYDQEIIYLHDTLNFQADSSWTKIPVIMKNDLPYVDAEIEVIPGEIVAIQLYIDLASGDALELLLSDHQKFSLPDVSEKEYLGTGLSGDIYGYRGYSQRLNLFSFDLRRVRTAFAPAEVRSRQDGAEGVLGNDAIRRFNIIFDYAHSCLYIKPNKNINLPFK